MPPFWRIVRRIEHSKKYAHNVRFVVLCSRLVQFYFPHLLHGYFINTEAISPQLLGNHDGKWISISYEPTSTENMATINSITKPYLRLKQMKCSRVSVTLNLHQIIGIILYWSK